MTTDFLRRPSAPLVVRLLRAAGMVALALMLAMPATAPAREDAAQQGRRVKAVFLYRFIDYVAWPAGTFAEPEAPMVIGVMGDDRLATDLADALASRATGRRTVGVRRYHDGEPLAGMHMLFVGRSGSAHLGALAREAAGLPLLLVSEADGALDQGSAINFTTTGGRVRFDVAVDAAESHGLKLSSRLLAVARKVRPAPG